MNNHAPPNDDAARKESLRRQMIEERRRKVSNAVAFAKGTKFDAASTKPRASSTTFDHKKLKQQANKNKDEDMEAAEAYFTESEELRVGKPQRASSMKKPRTSRVNMLGQVENENGFKDEHSTDTLGATNETPKYYVDKKAYKKNTSLFDLKTCVIATIIFSLFLSAILGVVLGMVLNNGDGNSNSSSATTPAENSTETLAPTTDATALPVEECTIKTQQLFPQMTTMTLYLGVNSNTTLDDLDYVANMAAKSYGEVGSGDMMCDTYCRQIIETEVISSVRVQIYNGEDSDSIMGMSEDCPQTMKLVVGVEGTYFGCGGDEDDFPGLFGIPGDDVVLEDGKRLIRRRAQECSCQDTAITRSFVSEDAHEAALIAAINPMLEAVDGVCNVKAIEDTSGGVIIGGGIYVAPP